MKHILITGGAGFVGRHFTKHFLEQGDSVVCVDNIAPLTGGIHPDSTWPLFEPRDFENFTFHKKDCRQFFQQDSETHFDIALHLAALVGGREVIENNPLAVAEDLAIDAAYWVWATKSRPSKTICFSSSAAYPVALQRKDTYRLLKESDIEFGDSIGMPDMTYGWAKLTNEYLARLAFTKEGLSSVTYRPFSGYGEDQDDAYPFPSICKRALAQRGSIAMHVWGTGDQMRDFIHIDDCVRGVVETMDKINDGSAVNLSTGRLTTFKDFAKTACAVLGYHPDISGTSTKPEGVFARGGETSLQKRLGFEHSISFEEGIERMLNYLQSVR